MKKLAVFIFIGFLMIPFSGVSQWMDLLDKDLSQWENYLSYRYPEGYDGEIPKDAEGNDLKPIGLNKDEFGVFTMIEEDGQPVLRISGEIYGCVATKSEFENYHLKLQVKWGDKKWHPRKQLLKDSGFYTILLVLMEPKAGDHGCFLRSSR